MTIYLPERVNLFRQAFDSVCDRILSSEKDATFYALFVKLATNLQNHSLLKDSFHELEAESAKRKHEFSIAALEALEDSWIRLWKYHRHRLKHRKQLVRIKRAITAPNEISCSPLYNRVLSHMRDFRYFSPLFRFIDEAPRLFRAVQSELHLSSIRFDCLYPSRDGYFAKRKVIPCKLSKKYKRRDLHTKIFVPEPNSAMPFKRPAERIPLALYSPKTEAIERRFFIPGRNEDEIRQNTQIMAETNFAFCWEKVWFLQQCYAAERAIPVPKSSKGRWPSIRETEWKSAEKRCEIEALLGAKMSHRQKIAIKPCSSIDSFLMYEYQIHRRDYVKYLKALKNHIHTQLFKIESVQQEAEEDPLVLPGTQKADFVIDLARKFWKANPSGKRDAAYEEYCARCPFSKILKRNRWDQLVRERNLDPRPRESKKRGRGKKTLKN